MIKKSQIYLGIIASISLAGCAVSYSDIADMRESKTQTSEAQIKRTATQLKQEQSLTRMSGNFLGDTPIDLPYAAKLPPIFFENVIIRQRGLNYGTVAQAAKNISLATGLSVWTNPDVDAVIPGTSVAPAAFGAGLSPQRGSNQARNN